MFTLRNDTTGTTSEHTSLLACKQRARRLADDNQGDEAFSYWTIITPAGGEWRGSRGNSRQRNPGKDVKRLEWVERKKARAV
jgi:hypothetical protein